MSYRDYKFFNIEENPDIIATLEAIDYIYCSLEDKYGSTYAGVDSKTLLKSAIEILNLRGKLDFIFVTDYEKKRDDS